MDHPEPALDETIRQIAALFAETYLSLRRQAEKGLASPETESVHVTGG